MRSSCVAALVLFTWAAGCGRAAPPPPAPDGERAFRHLRAQVECGPRLPGSAAAERARRHLTTHLGACAERVAAQEFRLPDPYGSDSLRLVNVLAHFYTQRAKRVLLGAHYDSRPWADQDTGAARDLPVPGANDGASGVAVLLEIATALATWDPGIGVDLVFLDGEDYGREGDTQNYLLGSRYFVRTMGAYRPQAFVLVDMVGDADLRLPMEGYSLAAAPVLTRLVYGVADSLGVKSFVAAPGPAVIDDHVPFLEARIPALDLIDFDYPYWHTTRDVPEACSPQSLADVAWVLLNTLMRLGAGARAS